MVIRAVSAPDGRRRGAKSAILCHVSPLTARETARATTTAPATARRIYASGWRLTPPYCYKGCQVSWRQQAANGKRPRSRAVGHAVIFSAAMGLQSRIAFSAIFDVGPVHFCERIKRSAGRDVTPNNLGINVAFAFE